MATLKRWDAVAGAYVPLLRGPRGYVAAISVGTTTTGAPGVAASVTNTGDTHDAVLNFVIPQGVPGVDGANANVTVVFHGADATTARPDFPSVFWIGSVPPDNIVQETDLYFEKV